MTIRVAVLQHEAETSSFYGIVIAMYYRDHHPPRFHATPSTKLRS
jgi:hypothetical protein